MLLHEKVARKKKTKERICILSLFVFTKGGDEASTVQWLLNAKCIPNRLKAAEIPHIRGKLVKEVQLVF